MVPRILGHGRVRLEVRAEVSEVANDLSSGTGVPGFRVRRVNTGVVMNAGHTLALAGDYREEVEGQNRGIPGIMNLPALGIGTRRVQETRNETELVFLITPRFVNEVPHDQMPLNSLGRLTESPSNAELYGKGYIEVPKCNEDCPTSHYQPPTGFQNWQSTIRNRSKNQHQISDQYQPTPIRQQVPAQNIRHQQPPQQQAPNGFGYPSYSIGDGKKMSYSIPKYKSFYQGKSYNRNHRQAWNGSTNQRRY